ncbi:hypothetical protein [Sporichthya polymorpha]|uniref:hypothetical protein n=1 Tax=Sporichthya polymorpha TaxID=35751 RepID=UPI0003813E07|nr:hypothetical protein [Sporichthya polymorpha]
MKRLHLATTAVLTAALAVPAAPAVAGTGSDSRAAVAGQSQGWDDRSDRDRRDGDRDRHRHQHWRGFTVVGVIEDVDLDDREIRVDRRRGSDRTLEVHRFTRIRIDGDRARLADLAEGDRVLVRGVKKHGDRYALRIWADRD